jgi:hypothetical protein
MVQQSPFDPLATGSLTMRLTREMYFERAEKPEKGRFTFDQFPKHDSTVIERPPKLLEQLDVTSHS